MHLVECVSFCNTTKLLTFLENEDEKVDWMSVINASIEGSPAQVEKLRRSFRERYNRFVRMLNKNVCFFALDLKIDYAAQLGYY